jgi:signal transduction histidine kinase
MRDFPAKPCGEPGRTQTADGRDGLLPFRCAVHLAVWVFHFGLCPGLYPLFGYALFWPSAEGWQGVSEGVLLNAALLGGMRFVQRFLKPGQQMAWTQPLLFAAMAGFAAFSASWLWVPLWSPEAILHFQNANDAFILLGLLILAVLPWLHFARTRHWEGPALWLAYSVLIGALGVQHVEALGWGPARGWGPGLERGLWAGMVILHAGTTILVLYRMRQVVLGQAKAKAELDTARVRLLRGLVLQEESERLRIGADLHDEAGSRFAALKMHLSSLAYDLQPGEKREALEGVIQSVDALSHANRQLAHRMLAVSLDKLGLEDALRAYRQRLLGEGRHLVLMLEPEALVRSDETAERLLYRVVQELVEGLFPDAPELRLRLQNASGEREWLLTVEAQEEESPLPSPDRQGPVYKGLAARSALFSSQRDHALEWTNGRLRMWLPKRVEQV